jgi:hypothetical protein
MRTEYRIVEKVGEMYFYIEYRTFFLFSWKQHDALHLRHDEHLTSLESATDYIKKYLKPEKQIVPNKLKYHYL